VLGSYLRGVQLVRPLETKSQFHYRLTRRHEEKKYESFITWDWKNKVTTDVSSAPGATANYFTKSDLPFETSPVFFRPDVLQRYKSDPNKYTLRERSIDCRGGWGLKTFDINEEGQVHTYIVYLRDLPHSEQLYWKAFNEPPKAAISKRAMATDFEGAFHLDYNPLQSIFTLTNRLSSLAAPWWSLKAPHLQSRVHYPVTDSSEEWANEIMALDKLLVEGFEKGWLKTKASELRQPTLPNDGSLVLTQWCLRGLGFDEQRAKETVAPLRELHNLRSKLKGHVAGSDAEGLRQAALELHGTYRKHFQDLCSRADAAMREIASAFGLTATRK
jgi:hypothetical protein